MLVERPGLYDLTKLRSYDGRFKDAAGDIWKHCIANNDWDGTWVFTDARFNLMRCPDETFLRFLCESVHPVVRRDRDQAAKLVELYNRHLALDQWELAVRTSISGHPVYSARRLLAGGRHSVEAAKTVAVALDAEYVSQQITRLETAVGRDPELAIGTAKEFVETVCKTILEEQGLPVQTGTDFPKLVRATLKELKLAPDDIPDQAKASDAIRLVLNNLASVTNGLAEIRNRYGTGHGKGASTKGLRPRHARLAVGAATTLAVFLYETQRDRAGKS
jgi:hypothetical protein